MNEYFTYDERLGIEIPFLTYEWEEYGKDTQQSIVLYWESIRGKIPDRIIELENIINEKQRQLEEEFDFPSSCRLNSQIAELASIINDLWIWYRVNQNVTSRRHS